METSRYGGAASTSGAVGASEGHTQPRAGGRVPRLRKAVRQCVPDILPCSVNQLLSSMMVNNVFTLNGHEVGRVSVTGVVKKIEVTSKFIRYKIDDMTSQPIGALEDVDEENGTQLVTVGAYVKAFGVLQCSGGANILKIACIHPLKNMNELTIHIVETVNAHMILGKSYPVYIGQRIASETEPAMASATGGRNEASGRESDEDSSDNQSSDQECSSNESSQEGSSHENRGILKSPRESTHVEEVLHLIHKCTLMEGKSFSDLQRELPSLTAENLQQAIKRLIGEGHIHTTADAEHFTCAV